MVLKKGVRKIGFKEELDKRLEKSEKYDKVHKHLVRNVEELTEHYNKDKDLRTHERLMAFKEILGVMDGSYDRECSGSKVIKDREDLILKKYK